MGLQNKLGERGIEMGEEFVNAINLMENSSKNLFITGRAGTGKSTLLSYFRSITKKNVVVLAPTGVAALNVKGQTIHSFFKFRPDITVEGVRRIGGYLSRQYKKIDTIIIDEISMVRADLLDCIDRFMRINGNDPTSPFGAVQMIFIGDLYQLPPVVSSGEMEAFKKSYASPYFFDSYAFNTINMELIELNTNYRQKDREFIDILNAIRSNTLSDEQLRLLNSRVRPNFDKNSMAITVTTTNRQADEINRLHLSNIPETLYTYKGAIAGDFDKNILPADERLELKNGAQIMMVNNNQDGLWVNGSIGRIKSINHTDGENDSVDVLLANGNEINVTPHTWELFKFGFDAEKGKMESKKVGSFRQYPIMLAWAVTIHKSQGKTFDEIIIDIGHGTFAHGQLYVAMSRCKTLEGIILRQPIERRHILLDQRIIQFMNSYKSRIMQAK